MVSSFDKEVLRIKKKFLSAGLKILLKVGMGCNARNF